MSWVDENLGLLIVIIVAAVIVVALFVYYCYSRRGRRDGYTRLELGVTEASQLQEVARKQQEQQQQAQSELELRYYLRSASAVSVERILPGIGSREGKHYALVRSNDPRALHSQQMLSVFERPERCVFPITDETKRIYATTLQRLQHPFVLPVVSADMDASHNMIYVFRPFSRQGSLRDLIHRSNPEHSYGRKYGAVGTPPSEAKIALYGRQILEALRYLEHVGVPYAHLTAANVIMDNGTCRVTGMELSLVAARPSIASLIAPLVKRNRAAATMLQFGHVLFEMAHGYELDTAVPTYISPKVPARVVRAIEAVFGGVAKEDEEGGQVIVPTVQQMLDLPLFAEALYQLKKADVAFVPPPLEPDMTEFLEAVRLRRKIEPVGPSRAAVVRKASSKRNTASKAPTSVSSTATPASAPSTAQSGAAAAATAPPTAAPAAPPAPSKSATASVTAAVRPAPPPPAPASAPPPPPPPSTAVAAPAEGRGALLSSISNFKGGLKKVKTNDRSAPAV